MDKLNAKILTLGDTTVGKTSILNRLIDNKFSKSQLSTIGIDFKIKKLNIKKLNIELKIWDTAGQADGILLIFDLTKRETFDKIYNWNEQLNNHFKKDDISIILIGNKKDLIDREVTFEEGNLRAKELNCEYFETSAKSGENINEAIMSLTKNILKKKGIMCDRTESIEINKKNHIQKTSQKSCC